jgi:aquaporin Z
MMIRALAAETFGTFWLVLGGCGSAVLAAAYPQLGIGFAGVALAFGLTVLTMAYAIGPVSGAHLNPAVTFGLAVAGRFAPQQVIPYVLAQLLGASLGALAVLTIASGKPGFDVLASGLATNGYGEHSPGHYTLQAAFLCEAILTAGFVGVILGATHERAPAGFAPIAIGLCLTLIHLISIPVTNTSVNPARSSGPAFIEGGEALSQLWLFWAAPLAGALVAGLVYRLMSTPPAVANPADGVDALG